jgi:hypothetical protein
MRAPDPRSPQADESLAGELTHVAQRHFTQTRDCAYPCVVVLMPHPASTSGGRTAAPNPEFASATVRAVLLIAKSDIRPSDASLPRKKNKLATQVAMPLVPRLAEMKYVSPLALKGPVKIPRAFTARADRSCGRTAARSPRRRVLRTEGRTGRHCTPLGPADAVPAMATAARVATTAATPTTLSTTLSLDPSAQGRLDPVTHRCSAGDADELARGCPNGRLPRTAPGRHSFARTGSARTPHPPFHSVFRMGAGR